VWASLVTALVLLVFVIAYATVPSRYARVSWALAVGRYVAAMLLIATLLAASYELRDEPMLRRFSPWGAFDQAQQAKLQATQHGATLDHSPDGPVQTDSHAR
jgi:hypothetical protein